MYDIYGIAPDAEPNPLGAWKESLHPDDRQRVLDALFGTIDQGDEISGEFRIVRPDGETRQIRDFARVMRAEDGTACESPRELDITEAEGSR